MRTRRPPISMIIGTPYDATPSPIDSILNIEDPKVVRMRGRPLASLNHLDALARRLLSHSEEQRGCGRSQEHGEHEEEDRRGGPSKNDIRYPTILQMLQSLNQPPVCHQATSLVALPTARRLFVEEQAHV